MNKQTFTVCLDAGHGGRDPGAVGNGLQEKDLTLTLALMARDACHKHGIGVLLTRSTDVFVSIGNRVKMANDAGVDALVSIHINSANTSTARGFETFAPTLPTPGRDCKPLQKKLHDALAGSWSRDRGMKNAGFQIIRTTTMPAVLIEFGFIVNPEDAALLKNNNFLKQQAEKLATALVEYAGITPIAEAKLNSLYRVSNENGQVGAFGSLDNAMNKTRALLESGAKRVIIENR